MGAKWKKGPKRISLGSEMGFFEGTRQKKLGGKKNERQKDGLQEKERGESFGKKKWTPPEGETQSVIKPGKIKLPDKSNEREEKA